MIRQEQLRIQFGVLFGWFKRNFSLKKVFEVLTWLFWLGDSNPNRGRKVSPEKPKSSHSRRFLLEKSKKLKNSKSRKLFDLLTFCEKSKSRKGHIPGDFCSKSRKNRKVENFLTFWLFVKSFAIFALCDDRREERLVAKGPWTSVYSPIPIAAPVSRFACLSRLRSHAHPVYSLTLMLTVIFLPHQQVAKISRRLHITCQVSSIRLRQVYLFQMGNVGHSPHQCPLVHPMKWMTLVVSALACVGHGACGLLPSKLPTQRQWFSSLQLCARCCLSLDSCTCHTSAWTIWCRTFARWSCGMWATPLQIAHGRCQ